MRTVLIIVYEFPPAGGPGVQRILKFTKYLPEFGWQPVVLTASAATHGLHDPALLKDVAPATPVYRVASPDINRLRPRVERLKLGKALAAANTALMLPDAALFWARLARPAVRAIMARHRPVAVLSSSPAASAHLIGQYAHAGYGAPWVADFRDPWSQGHLAPYFPGYRTINRRLEGWVVAQADHITTVSVPLAGLLRQLHGLPAEKITVIENGYDEDDVEALPPPNTERFTITYTGEFSRLRRPEAFVSAIDRLIATDDIPTEKLRVRFAGQNPPAFIPNRAPFEQLGYVSHDRLNALRRDSDLLLLIQGDFPTAPAKLYEYLGANRPTLCIADPDNAAAQLVRRTRGGAAVDHNPAQIAAAILNYYRAWQTGRFRHDPDWSAIRTLTRRSQAGQLAGVLEGLQ